MVSSRGGVLPMKIVYTCSYAYPSISGVWTRVENLAKEFSKRGHEVHVLTSNLIAGTDKTAEPYEFYEGIHINRFPVKIKLSKYQLIFTGKEFDKTLKDINPDIIDCQTYRHNEAKSALEYSLNNKIPCILTTHAPFLPVEVRGRKLSFLSKVYDWFIGKNILKKYSKVFRISNWELKYLLDLGLEQEKIIYSPNGVPREFFKIKIEKTKNQAILFLGRIEPRKQVHILINAFAKINKKYSNSKLYLAGPIENVENYENTLKKIIAENELEKKVIFLGPVYDLSKKIDLINSSQIYVLPSTWEGFPQSLIEAMSLGRCIIGSDCEGNMEVLDDEKTGFLFKIGDVEELAEKLEYCLSNNTTEVEQNAKLLAEKFEWGKIADKVEKVYQELI